ncbi:MAG: Ig-like domain-containing protein, partial [Candidatus Eiseniibacteriota bacterium]
LPQGLRRAAPLLGAVLLLASLVSCAKKGPPTGGPPDLEPPRLVSSVPDSGASSVPRDQVIALTFSEGMDPRVTAAAVSIAPRVDIRQRRWSGRTVTIVLAETLRANQTYTVFIGGGARDRHGNALEGRATVVFSTADTLPPGALDGQVVARGFSAGGTYLWCYDAAAGREPDSTARDFDAVGLADRDGRFRVVGLPVPGRYRLWAFADLNGNRSLEPDSDILTPVDTVFTLAAAAPTASGFTVMVVNPRSPGRVRGAVLDSLLIERGVLAVMAVAADDSLRQVVGTVDAEARYELSLPKGAWLVRAWRDLDRNRAWQRDTEPASAARRVEVQPAAEILDVDLALAPAPGGR